MMAEIPRFFTSCRPLVVIGTALLFLAPTWLQGRQERRVRQEEQTDYYRKWLNEDVKYIITPEEKEVFEGLTTPEERERFVEQFWYRRDPDPRTEVNEFKDEHYRRIVYANERFQSGIAGWKTDRGMVYIIHGRPDEIVAYPSGGRYLRQPHEGGGSTSTYPFEVWRYRHIEGVGQDIELEFVDPSWAGEYHLATNPDEKDALLRVPNAGLTLAEELGLARKMERPFFQPGNDRYPLHYQFQRINKDTPFARYETITGAQRPVPIKYTDLREIVKVNLSYNDLDFQVRADYFNLNDQTVLVPVTVEVPNKDLTFEDQNGVRVARLAVYGIITTMTKRLVDEFEEDRILAYRPEGKGMASRSSFQRVLVLDKKQRYRLDLVVKDINSGRTGVVQKGLAPLPFETETFSASSVILSDLILPQTAVDADEMFVLGDIKVRPSVGNRFSTENPLGVYLQLYNLAIDQATSAPSLETRYRILRDGRSVLELRGGRDEGLRLYGNQRAVLIRSLPTANLQPGSYRLEIEVRDRLRNEQVTVMEQFDLIASRRDPAAK